MKKYLKYLCLFVLFCLVCLGNLQNLCRVYPTFGSDSQTLLLWEYTAKIGMLPYRDIFYPYGMLNYYMTQNIYFFIGYFLIAPILFFIIFLALKRLFNNNLYAFTAIVFIYFFIIRITGFETFTRYGILIAYAIAIAFYYSSNEKHSKKILLLLGLTAGLIFPFIVDVGFYAPVLFVLFSLSNIFFKFDLKKTKDQMGVVLKEILFFLFGFCIGIIPFAVYLSVTRSIIPFFAYLRNLHDIALYAKTPFIHSLSSPDNLFVLIVLIIGISYLSILFILKKQKATFKNYFQIGMIIILILLEQKSIIRSIDTQLTFIGFLLLLSLFADVKIYFEKLHIQKSYIYLYFIAILTITLFHLGLRPIDTSIDNFPSIKNEMQAVGSFYNKTCVNNNVQFLVAKNNRYLEIEKRVKIIPQFKGKVFVFPGDPIFYILFNQRPPFYPSIYEATPLYAQKTLLQYIKDNNIQVIIYNSNIKSIQDGVPDTLRGKLVYQFIRENYHVVDSQDGFLILVKTKKK
jgi:hypothetical protein